MAIGPIHIAWMRHLARKGGLPTARSVFDFGPQDVQVRRPIMAPLAQEVLGGGAQAYLDRLYAAGDMPSRTSQADFWSLLGAKRYESIDLDDDRATYKRDLNMPIADLPEFDVVTNFGTTEHVFNIGEALRTIHRVTAPGGMSLHAVPVFAFSHHGFYTVGPNLFIELCRANGYDLVDLTYMDNAFVRNEMLNEQGLDRYDLDDFPIRVEDMRDTQVFMTKTVELFYANLVAEDTRRLITALGAPPGAPRTAPYPSAAHPICFVFDLAFVAMRRPAERRDFVMPIQNAAGVPPLPAKMPDGEGDGPLAIIRRILKRP